VLLGGRAVVSHAVYTRGVDRRSLWEDPATVTQPQNPAVTTAIGQAFSQALGRESASLSSRDGIFEEELDNFAAASAEYRAALRHDPGAEVALKGLGRLLEGARQFVEARQHYQEWLIRLPEAFDAMLGLVRCQLALGQSDEAHALVQRLTQHFPNEPRAHWLAARQAVLAGDHETAAKHWLVTLRLDDATPVEGWQELLAFLTNLGNLGWLEVAARDAVARFPEEPALHATLAHALEQQGKAPEAVATYDTLSVFYPKTQVPVGLQLRQGLMLPPIPASEADLWHWRERFMTFLDEVGPTLPDNSLPNPLVDFAQNWFYLAYHHRPERGTLLKLAQLFRRLTGIPAHRPEVVTGRHGVAGKTRVGFVTRFGRASHTIGRLYRQIIHQLDRRRFDVFVYGIELDFADTDCPPDNIAVDTYRHLPRRNLPAMVAAIEADQPDLLFYLDLGMDPATYFLAMHRLAPVQAMTWGHPLTSGLETMDYFVSSQWYETAQAPARDYAETLVQLPTLGHAFTATCHTEPDAPFPALSEAMAGGGRLYTCVQSLFKLHPALDALWADVLRQDPQATLLLVGGKHAYWDKALLARFQAHHPDVAGRLKTTGRPLSRAEFITLQRRADVILDTPWFCGGNTTMESFECAQPVVALEAPYLRGRLTSGFHRYLGLEDWTTNSFEDFTAEALRLAQDPAYKADKAEILKARAPQLWSPDAHRATVASWEHFFDQAVDEHAMPMC
jgi:protein O-GlcNAc transferase